MGKKIILIGVWKNMKILQTLTRYLQAHSNSKICFKKNQLLFNKADSIYIRLIFKLMNTSRVLKSHEDSNTKKNYIYLDFENQVKIHWTSILDTT